jgi:hypothetical protein
MKVTLLVIMLVNNVPVEPIMKFDEISMFDCENDIRLVHNLNQYMPNVSYVAQCEVND